MLLKGLHLLKQELNINKSTYRLALNVNLFFDETLHAIGKMVLIF